MLKEGYLGVLGHCGCVAIKLAWRGPKSLFLSTLPQGKPCRLARPSNAAPSCPCIVYALWMDEIEREAVDARIGCWMTID